MKTFWLFTLNHSLVFFCHFLNPAVSRNLGWSLGQGQSGGLRSASRTFWNADKGLQAPCALTMALFPLCSQNRHGRHLGSRETNNGSRPERRFLFSGASASNSANKRQLEEMHCGGRHGGHGARDGVSGSSVSQPTVFVSVYLEGTQSYLEMFFWQNYPGMVQWNKIKITTSNNLTSTLVGWRKISYFQTRPNEQMTKNVTKRKKINLSV